MTRDSGPPDSWYDPPEEPIRECPVCGGELDGDEDSEWCVQEQDTDSYIVQKGCGYRKVYPPEPCRDDE